MLRFVPINDLLVYMFKNAPANEMTYFDLIAAHSKEHIDVVKALASSNSNKILTAASVSRLLSAQAALFFLRQWWKCC